MHLLNSKNFKSSIARLAILICVILQIGAGTAFGGETVQLPKLQIEINRSELTNVEINGKSISAAQACKLFSKSFVRNGGLAATGPFVSAGCVKPDKSSKNSSEKSSSEDEEKTDDKKTDNSAEDETTSKKTKNESIWVMKIKSGDEAKTFEIYQGKTSSTPIASITIETDVSPVILMQGRETGPLIAAYLSTKLPFRSILSRKRAASGDPLQGKLGSLTDLKFPVDMKIFTLKSIKGTFQPHVISSMKGPTKSKGLISWKHSEESESVKWSETHYFVQHASDRTELLEAIKAKIVDSTGNLEDKYFSLGRRLLIGGRYGISIGSKDALLSKASMVGALAEIRSGPLEGLRFNYDSIPIRKIVDEEGERDFSWSRYQLGYAFGGPLRNALINWWDITPRIGFTNLKHSYEPTEASEYLPYSFQQTRAPTAGMEIGLESRTSYLLMRLWVFGTYSVGVLPIDKQYKTQAVRSGLDIYTNLVKIDSVSLALLGFAAIDSTNIKRSTSEDNVTDSVDSVSSLTFRSVFAGAGLTLGW